MRNLILALSDPYPLNSFAVDEFDWINTLVWVAGLAATNRNLSGLTRPESRTSSRQGDMLAIGISSEALPS